MKGLLLDQGLPRHSVILLRESGIQADHVGELGMSTATDLQILEYARERDLIVVTLDADFHLLLATSGAAKPSVVRLREQKLNSQMTAASIRVVLEQGGKLLESGAIASATKNLVRFKRLPIRPRP